MVTLKAYRQQNVIIAFFKRKLLIISYFCY
jgi:hypothetical protein